MSEYKLIETTPEIYVAIYSRHQQDLVPFSSFTDCDSGWLLTEWGFKHADWPLIRWERRWNPRDPEETAVYRHWLIAPIKDAE